MARFTTVTLLSCLAVFALIGCSDGQARTSLRNAAVAAKSLESHPDPKVQAVGQAIESQVTAAADQADERLWGLYTDRSKATISLEDWEESWNSSLRRSLLQAEATRQETEENRRLRESASGLLGMLGLPIGVGGGSAIFAAGLWLLKNRKDLKEALSTAVNYGNEVAPVTSPEEVAKIQDRYSKTANPVLKAAVAKAKARSKVS